MRSARKQRLLIALSTLSNDELNALLRGYEAFANALDADDTVSQAAV